MRVPLPRAERLHCTYHCACSVFKHSFSLFLVTGGANFPPTHTCLPVCDFPTNAISMNKGVLIHSRPLPHLPTRALAIRCLRTSHSVLPAPGLHCLNDGAFAPSTHCLLEPGLPHSLSLPHAGARFAQPCGASHHTHWPLALAQHPPCPIHCCLTCECS